MPKDTVVHYGAVALKSAYCPDCKKNSFVKDGAHACCGRPYVPTTGAVEARRESSSAAKQRARGRQQRAAIVAAQGGKCFYCGIDLSGTVIRNGEEIQVRTHIDHVTPWAWARSNRPDNLVAACHVCNGIKSSLMFPTADDCREFVLARRAKKGYSAPETAKPTVDFPVEASVSTGYKGDSGVAAQTFGAKDIPRQSRKQRLIAERLEAGKRIEAQHIKAELTRNAKYDEAARAERAEAAIAKAKAILNELYSRLRTWREVAKAVYGFKAGYLHNVAKGKRVPSEKLLVALEIAPPTMPAPVCPSCGEVHTVGWCTKVYGEPARRHVREVSQYIERWPTARLRWAFDNREVMA